MLKRKAKIGIISLEDPTDRNVSSGTNYKIVETLRREGADIIWLHPYHSWLWIFLERTLRNIYKLLSSKTFMFRHTCMGAFLESHSIKREKIEKCDIVFASFSSPACYKLRLPEGMPLFYISDALWHSMIGYYLKHIDNFSKHDGDKIESYVLNKASKIIAPSKWMRNSAINDYHQPAEKICSIQFGANIDEKDIKYKKFEKRPTLDLLFIGVDWKRKGGKIAIEAAQWLNDNGVPTTLHIIGGRDIDNASLATKNIDYIGMLDKNSPKDYKKLIEELYRDQVLVFPTQAECAGIVTCEACAFGLPVYGSDTGGVGSYIADGENGRLLPLGSKGKDYGMKIKQDLLSGKLEEMSALARKRYEEDLNWNTFGGKIASLINNYL